MGEPRRLLAAVRQLSPDRDSHMPHRLISSLLCAVLAALAAGCAAIGSYGPPAADGAPAPGTATGFFMNDGGDGDPARLHDLKIVAERRDMADEPAPNPNLPAATAIDTAASIRATLEAQRTATEPAPSRLLAREAWLTLQVHEVDSAVDAFIARVEELGGYVNERQDTRLTARIPATRLDAVLAELEGGGRVLSRSVRATDVTDQVNDLDIRLKNARLSRERLLKLLEDAKKVEDVLAIEKELQRLTTEIERVTAQLETMKLRVTMSLLTVTFRPVQEPTDPGPQPRAPSRFGWIRSVGVDAVLERF